MDEQVLRDIWHKHIDFTAYIGTELRKSILLKNDLRVVFEGKSYEIKFKNMGGGVWQVYTEKMA